MSFIQTVLMFVMLAWSSFAFSQSWVILADADFQGLPAEFTGTVAEVRKGGQAIAVRHGKQTIPFKFDAKRGTPQQRALLDTVKPGERIRVRQSKVGNDVMYQLEPVRK